MMNSRTLFFKLAGTRGAKQSRKQTKVGETRGRAAIRPATFVPHRSVLGKSAPRTLLFLILLRLGLLPRALSFTNLKYSQNFSYIHTHIRKFDRYNFQYHSRQFFVNSLDNERRQIRSYQKYVQSVVIRVIFLTIRSRRVYRKFAYAQIEKKTNKSISNSSFPQGIKRISRFHTRLSRHENSAELMCLVIARYMFIRVYAHVPCILYTCVQGKGPRAKQT